MHRNKWAGFVFAALLLLCGATALTVFPNAASAAQPQQLYPPRTFTLYGPTAVTTGTTYSDAPLMINGQDFARVTNFSEAAVYVSTGANSAGTVTVTIQTSADAAVWADAKEIVHTFNSTGTLSSSDYFHKAVLTGADDADVINAPLSGEFMRVKVQATGTLTPTVKATLR
jgi:hypothetical protein